MTDHRDPLLDPEWDPKWEPASSDWARRQALEATRAAVRAVKDKRKKPPEEQR